jgi:hypothetical protein
MMWQQIDEMDRTWSALWKMNKGTERDCATKSCGKRKKKNKITIAKAAVAFCADGRSSTSNSPFLVSLL